MLGDIGQGKSQRFYFVGLVEAENDILHKLLVVPESELHGDAATDDQMPEGDKLIVRLADDGGIAIAYELVEAVVTVCSEVVCH